MVSNRQLPKRRAIRFIVAVTLIPGLPSLMMRFSEAADASGDAKAKQASGVSAPVGKSEQEVQQRVRELIYILRYHRNYCRQQELGAAIGDLVRIGKPAVPEMVAELDRIERAGTVREIAFTLRAIGDHRAIPGLLRALAKTKNRYQAWREGDIGTSSDPAVLAALQKNEYTEFLRSNRITQSKSDVFHCGPPIYEIASALEKITGHKGETVDLNDPDRSWSRWWETRGPLYLSAEERNSMQLPKRDRDLVEEAGIARFGPMFATGKEVVLGPVRDVELTVGANGRSYIDFDTGRTYRPAEGISDARKSGDLASAYDGWIVDKGIDAISVRSIRGFDLMLWLIDNRRWETLESEIRSGRSLDLGTEAGGIAQWLTPKGRPEDADYREQQMGTFLFITREGGRGMIQCFPRDDRPYLRKIRYRMWGDHGEAVATPPQRTIDPRGSKWAPERTVTLQKLGRGRRSFLNLITGESVVPPESVISAASLNPTLLGNEKEIEAWCRTQNVDFAAAPATKRRNTRGPWKSPALVGFDMIALEIVPTTFDDFTPAEFTELIASRPKELQRKAWMPHHFDGLIDTYAFRTRTGTFGVLQIKSVSDDSSSITFRYRLASKAEVKH